MRILYLAPYVPGQAMGGSSVVTYNVIKRLSLHHQIVLLCLSTHSELEQESIRELGCLNVRVVAHTLRQQRYKLLSRVRGLATIMPYSIQSHFAEEIKEAFQRLVTDFRPDLIHIELLQMSSYALNSKVPTVYYAHNVEADRYLSQLRLRRLNKWQRLIQKWDHVRTSMAEKRICKRASWVLTVTHEDTVRLNQKYGVSRVSTIRPGVDLDVFQPLAPVHQPHIVFAGSMFYEPNIDAMKWFCHEVLPTIRERIPDVRLTIVGRDPSPEVLSLGNYPAVTVTGAVKSVSLYFAQAAISVNPVRTGGGIKQKLLEAMAMQRAVVTTSFGCVGIPAQDREEVFIANDAESFAEDCIWLLTHFDERVAVARKARQFIEVQFSWDRAVKQLEDVYNRVTKAPVDEYHKNLR